jgi:hypothetical protein
MERDGVQQVGRVYIDVKEGFKIFMKVCILVESSIVPGPLLIDL